MDADRASMYWRGITVIEAQETLLNLRIATFSNAKQGQRDRWHRELHKMAYPVVHSGAPITTEELSKRIADAING
jgi:hypothetical protein